MRNKKVRDLEICNLIKTVTIITENMIITELTK